YARQNNSSQTELVPEHHEESLRASIAPDMSTTQFRAFVATKMRLYYSVDQWMEDSARFDFSIGLRLHGNMAAWQSGTPAIWIYHDSRTRELAETMALPHISHMDYLKIDSLEQLRNKVDFSFSQYGKRRKLLKDRYKKILDDAGISHVFD
ncbi:polysaccharide pyruvyl transferase family protein, partial [Vibrio parahaemolyticus]